jgi:hypothetical protein
MRLAVAAAEEVARWARVTAVRRFVIALAVSAVAFACDRSPTDVPPSPGPSPQHTASPGAPYRATEVVPCSELPDDAATQVIGPAGGSIRVGPHSLRIPQGALGKAVSITASLAHEDDGYNAVQLDPHGLKFRTPAYLTMSYANCDVGDGSRLPHLQIVYRHAGNIVEHEPSVSDLASRKVTGEITHFSNYAIAW